MQQWNYSHGYNKVSTQNNRMCKLFNHHKPLNMSSISDLHFNSHLSNHAKRGFGTRSNRHFRHRWFHTQQIHRLSIHHTRSRTRVEQSLQSFITNVNVYHRYETRETRRGQNGTPPHTVDMLKIR